MGELDESLMTLSPKMRAQIAVIVIVAFVAGMVFASFMSIGLNGL